MESNFAHNMNNGIKIGLLVNEDSEFFGGVHGIIANFRRRFKEIAPSIEMVPYVSVHGEMPTNVDDCSGYVLTGSHYSVNDDQQWMKELQVFIKKVFKRNDIPLVAICFAHQLIGKTFGGVVGNNPCGRFIWKCGKVNVTKEFAHKSFYQEAGLRESSLNIMQSHFEQILTKPKYAKVVGKCSDCHYEVLLYGDNILTLQGHPEIVTKRMLSKVEAYQSRNVLTQDEVKTSLNSFKHAENDSVMRLICNFLLKV